MIKRLFSKKVETRAFSRLKAYSYIKYRQASAQNAGFLTAALKDISASGLLFLAKEELPQGAALDICIDFPGLPPLNVKASVVRVIRTQAGEYQTAVYFMSIDEGQKAQLAKRIEFILRNMPKKKFFGISLE